MIELPGSPLKTLPVLSALHTALAIAPNLTRGALRRQAYRFNWSLSRRLGARFRTLDSAKAQELSEYTRAHYANISDEGDIDQALADALIEDRTANVPWLDAALRLDGARILEIGSGTGESTLALAEQGAAVTGIDVDANALEVGRKRLSLYDLRADLQIGNAADVASQFRGQTFDMVIFFASLEHMTLAERFAAIRQTWDMLRPGGCWVVVEAPNRLWFHDGHTSMENFYHWLPDELAARWAHRAQRDVFAKEFPPLEPTASHDTVKLARWGRGVSFHEFDLVLGDARSLNIVSNKTDFLRRSNPLLLAHSLVSRARRYERFLEQISPQFDRGFFKQYLDLIIRKP